MRFRLPLTALLSLWVLGTSLPDAGAVESEPLALAASISNARLAQSLSALPERAKVRIDAVPLDAQSSQSVALNLEKFTVFAPDAVVVAATTLAPYADNGDGTVTDLRTGLIWMRCAMGQTWTGSTCSGTASTYTWAAAVALTGATSFAGKSDWRLPNVRELQTIVDRSAYISPLPTAVFPNAPPTYFWSASSRTDNLASAWFVYVKEGSSSVSSKIYDFPVRLVRSGQSLGLLNPARPTIDYVDQHNGTTMHTPSGLMWKRCAEGQSWSGSTCTGTARTYTWAAAQGLNSPFAGQSDWRLPTAEELLSLADYTISSSAINATLFPLTPSNSFWSASSYAPNLASAWVVSFDFGYAAASIKGSSLRARLVRGGQSIGNSAKLDFNGHSYQRFNTAIGWTAANLFCEAKGAHLATITSQAENNFIATNFGSDVLWLGGSDAALEGSWKWITGEAWSYSNWNDGEPNNQSSIENYLQFNRFFRGGWNDINEAGNGDSQPLCEWESVNSPSTFALTSSTSGSGSISSAPAGIACGSTCSATFNSGTSVILTATPASGSRFTGWGGACTGTATTCTLSMTAAKSVTASFIVTTLAPYTDNGDGTVTDPRTGLIWMRCAMGQTWTGSTCGGTATAYTWAAAVALTGATSFASKSDWRLPNIRELQSIVDRSTYDPAINTAAFPNMLSLDFWSGSIWAGNPTTGAWAVNFDFGTSGAYELSSFSFNVRLVRGSQSPSLLGLARPTSDYVNNGNGTASHTASGLIWKRCAEGQSWSGSTCIGSAGNYSWAVAKGLSSTFAGKSDWRLPTQEELLSLVDYTIYAPAINTTLFPNTESKNFWSSSPYVADAASAWRVDFTGGRPYANLQSDSYPVRLVRSGVFALSVSTSGSGSISSAPAGIACGSTCSATFNSGTSVILTATPASGNRFTGWGGACTGTATTCTLSMTAAKSVTASFIVTTLAPYTDNGDGTVTDPRTGLIWMRCAMGQTWTGSTCSGTASTYTWAAAVALTGATSFAGKSDWRLPNIRELQSIVDRSTYNPAINTVAFPNTQNDWFWSASSLAPYPAYAWDVDFSYGSTGTFLQSGNDHVRLVRSGQSLGLLNPARPTADYVDQGNGTAAHTPSGLIWKRCAEGQTWSGSTCIGSASTYTWDAARALSSTFAGNSDWRLPTAEELLSLADYTTYSPAINATLFPLTPWAYFWSASSYALNPTDAWYVDFNYGGTYAYSLRNHVRLVRSGQSPVTFALSVSISGLGFFNGNNNVVGTLTSNAGGINCARSAMETTYGTCTASFATGATVTLTATPGVGMNFTGWGGACAGTSATCTLTMNAAQSVTASFSSLASQSIAFGAAPSIVVGGTGRASATASSGLLVAFSSLSAGICTVSGSTVTGIAVGTCTLAANQAGNSSINPAPQVTLSFSITALPFDPPTMISITGGSGSATIYFSPPSNTGGSPISSYTATCTASGQATRTAASPTSPLTVKNLTGGVLYQCSLTATNSAGLTSNASAALPVTPRKKSNLTPILMLLLD